MFLRGFALPWDELVLDNLQMIFIEIVEMCAMHFAGAKRGTRVPVIRRISMNYHSFIGIGNLNYCNERSDGF